MEALISKDGLKVDANEASERHLAIGGVVIGRNEGQRLVTCLDSISSVDKIVYVDSGSIDNSIQEAKSREIDVIILDKILPFTAARARNEGANHLIQKFPELRFIQFVDGDCEIQSGWVHSARAFLSDNSGYAVVCGRRRERFPEQSIFNKLCDIEWNSPVGEALACGGDALINVEAFVQVAGYRNDLIAGEEPEMCFRLRQLGWKIYRLDAEMTLHDAAMTKISQWWKRTLRSGYAFALGSAIHGKSKERYWVKENQRIMIWGIFLPLFILINALIKPIFLGLILIYPAQILRLGLKRPDLGRVKYFWAISMVLGKLPEALGLLRFWINKCTRSSSAIIEYK